MPFKWILLTNCSMYILYTIFGPVFIAGIMLTTVQYMYRFCTAIALSSNLRIISAIVVVGGSIGAYYVVPYFRGESLGRQLMALTQQITGIKETQNTLIDNQNKILQILETMQKDNVSNGTS